MSPIPAIDDQVPRQVSGTGTYAGMLILGPLLVFFPYLLILVMIIPQAIEDKRLGERGVVGRGEIADLYLGNRG